MVESRSITKQYRQTVFGVVRVIFLAGSVIFLCFSLAASADLLFGIGWGYPWTTIPGGIGAAILSYVGSRFVRWIEKTVEGALG